MTDRVSFLQGLVASFDTSDLLTVNIFVQQRLAGINAPPPQSPVFVAPLLAPPPPAAAVVGRKPAAIPTAETPLPPAAKTNKPTKPREFRPSKGNAAIRILDNAEIAEMSFKDFSDKIASLLENLQVTRIIKGEPEAHNVKYQFTLLDKDEDDAARNTALIVFPYGCMDFCRAAFPLVKKAFGGAGEIYTGGVKKGQWE